MKKVMFVFVNLLIFVAALLAGAGIFSVGFQMGSEYAHRKLQYKKFGDNRD